MKVIIAGSRNLGTLQQIKEAVTKSEFEITEVVSGRARGVDRCGEIYAELLHIPVKCFPADWEQYGKSAGYKRNQQMAEYADALIAIWDGHSKGTKHMINIMSSLDKPIYLYQVFDPIQEKLNGVQGKV
jgi:hypothetical protein